MSGGCLRSCVIFAVFVLTVAGCSAPPKPAPDPGYQALVEPNTRVPENDLERSILGRLDELAADAEITIGGSVVLAGRAYAAASGRRCRMVTIRDNAPTAGDNHRLACIIAGSWAFVPEVLRMPVEGGGP